MKIQRITVDLVCLPIEEPLVGAPPFQGMLREFVTVRIGTDDADGLAGFLRSKVSA